MWSRPPKGEFGGYIGGVYKEGIGDSGTGLVGISGMKIAFYGDSLTAGIPGAAYFDILKQQLPGYSLYNYGKINDTTLSLYRRIKARRLLHPVNLAFIVIGVNDLLLERSWLFGRIRRHWAHGDEEFRQHYETLLRVVRPYAEYVITVPPLFIGEDFDGLWQQRCNRRADIVAQLTQEYPTTHYLDIRRYFAQDLKNKPTIKGLSGSPLQAVWDYLTLRTDSAITRVSAERGFHYTLDGVHLNVAGARIVAAACLHIIQALSNNVS
jgi:lysophospholipase L1-like esterase